MWHSDPVISPDFEKMRISFSQPADLRDKCKQTLHDGK